MITLNNTNLFLFIAVIVMILLILFQGESYKNDNKIHPSFSFPVYDNDDINDNNDMNNPSFVLGNYFYPEWSKQYKLYNAYKADPTQQPITLPSVDYTKEFESTLSKKCNPMYAIPEKETVYINLLNASKNY